MIYEHLVSIPTYKVRAFIRADIDGNYHVYYNDKMCHEIQKKSSKHEKDHIDNDDLYGLPKELL